MALNLLNLNDIIRKLMLSEVDYDAQRGRTYLSPRLNRTGQITYLAKLKHAIESQDAAWLAEQLHGYFDSIELTKSKKGTITSDIPKNADETIAESEFNRFYMRALCLFAVEKEIKHLIVCRTKHAGSTKPTARAKVGSSIAPQKLLNDLRENVGKKTRLGLGEPSSSLTVRLP
jgi:hypothetical protein